MIGSVVTVYRCDRTRLWLIPEGLTTDPIVLACDSPWFLGFRTLGDRGETCEVEQGALVRGDVYRFTPDRAIELPERRALRPPVVGELLGPFGHLARHRSHAARHGNRKGTRQGRRAARTLRRVPLGRGDDVRFLRRTVAGVRDGTIQVRREGWREVANRGCCSISTRIPMNRKTWSTTRRRVRRSGAPRTPP